MRQQRNGALAALSLRQYSAAVALFQRISNFIVQTVASRSVTQSTGLTMSRAAAHVGARRRHAAHDTGHG